MLSVHMLMDSCSCFFLPPIPRGSTKGNILAFCKILCRSFTWNMCKAPRLGIQADFWPQCVCPILTEEPRFPECEATRFWGFSEIEKGRRARPDPTFPSEPGSSEFHNHSAPTPAVRENAGIHLLGPSWILHVGIQQTPKYWSLQLGRGCLFHRQLLSTRYAPSKTLLLPRSRWECFDSFCSTCPRFSQVFGCFPKDFHSLRISRSPRKARSELSLCPTPGSWRYTPPLQHKQSLITLYPLYIVS